jgi:hypothetical protein
MPTFAVDTRNTFANVVLMGAGPKLEYGTGAQATTQQGVPRWELQVAVAYLTGPGERAQTETLNVTVNAADNPAKDMAMPVSIEFDQLRAGVSAPEQRSNERGTRVVGGKLWYQAAGIRASVNGHRQPAKADAA